VAVRRKRSISVPPELDAQIEAEAAREGMTYSAWLAEAAHKELTIRAGLDAVAEVEREIGRFTGEELAEAEAWTEAALTDRQRSGGQRRQAA
jgi:hypothetical protein